MRIEPHSSEPNFTDHIAAVSVKPKPAPKGYREALEEVRAGVEGLDHRWAGKASVLDLLDRLSKGTDG